MLTDSYSKLYNTKIKKFLMDDVPSVEGGYVNGEFTAKPPVQSSSKANQRNDMGLPRLGVDFGLLKSKTLITDANADSDSYEGSLTDGSNLNLPPLGLGLNGTNLSEAQVPRFKIGARCPDLDLPEDPNVSTTSCMQLQNTDHPSFDNAMRNLENPQIGLEVPEVDVGLKGSNITTPEMGIDLDGRNFCGPSVNSSIPKVAIEGRNQEFKMPTFKLPDLGLSGSSFSGPECDVKHEDTPGKLNIIGTDTDMPLGEIKMSHKKPRISLKSPDLDLDAQSGMLKSDADVKTPDLRLKTSKLKGGMSAPDANIPKADLKGENWATDAPSVSIKGSSGKYRAPTFRMPKFDLPVIQVPGTLPKGPNLKLNAPDINVPNVDLKAQKLKINAPKTNLDFPSGDLKMPELHGPDWDVNAPSGKLKMPKFNLSGTLPKGPNLDLNADLNSPDLNPKVPKIKGGIDAPDLDLPDMDLKAPKLDMNTPGVNIGSPKGKLKFPKMKMPKFNLPSLKGPGIDGNLDGPDVDINAPNVNLKTPKADLDLDISGPSGKFKKPNLHLPDLGFSGPKLEGPNLDLKTPDLDISGPNFNFKGSKNSFEFPDVDFGSPSGKFKTPHLGFSAPKTDLPKVDLNSPDVRAKVPKGPNLKLNSNLKTPDLNLKAPKMKGGLDVTKVDLPNMDLKAPNLEMDTADVDIGLPEATLDVTGAKGKFKIPSLNTPDLSISGPQAKTPHMRLSGPGVSMSDFNLPDANFKSPKLNTKHPDVGINGNIGQPGMDFNGPQLRGIRGPDVDTNIPLGNIHGPHADLNLDRKLKQPYFKPPHFRSPDLHQMKGHISSPRVSAPNMNMNMPKVAMHPPQQHLRSPGRSIDDPSLYFRTPSHKHHTQDMSNLTMKRPDLDINGDIRLCNTDRRSHRTKVRSSFPEMDGVFDQHIDLNHSDLNIDDFTGKHHVLRARGSNLNVQAPHSHGHAISPSGVNTGMRDPRRIPSGHIRHNTRLPQFSPDSRMRASNTSDGYYVTVFPNQARNQKMPNRKYNTLGGLDFHPGNLDLEVPNEHDLRGSTFFFSNLV
uniref:Uncharacterized protein n=1 Tax=Neolamprologus brichardi TaxID=32507 RepID=A0A3Q4GC04_NEOBR